MAFPIVTVLGAAMGMGQSIFSGIAGNAAAAAQNRAATHQWDMNRLRAYGEYEINHLQNEAQWAWDMAQVAQLRGIEAQNALDKANWGSQMIDNAIRNLEINSGALYDRFVTEEALRGTQVALEYGYAQDARAAEAQQTAAQYMRQIRDNALQSDMQVSAAQKASVELQEQLLLSEQRDYLEYNVQKAAAVAESAKVTSRQGVRQGMGNTAQRLALEAGQKLGNVAKELNLRQQDRANKRTAMNSYFNTELSQGLGRLALQSEDAAERLKYSNNRYAADYALAKNQLDKLSIPSFQLAENQYGREIQSLQLQTDGVFQEASTEYRQREYLDPVKPIKGLSPMVMPPTKVKGPSTGSIIASSLMAGVGGALGGYEGKGKWG